MSPLTPSIWPGAALPGARVHLASNFTPPVFPNNFITWDTLDYDDAGYFSFGAPTQFVIPAGIGGRFLVGFSTDFAGTPSGALNINLVVSNQTDALCGTTCNTAESPNPLFTMCATWVAAAGATVRAQGSVTAYSGNNDTTMWLLKIG